MNCENRRHRLPACDGQDARPTIYISNGIAITKKSQLSKQADSFIYIDSICHQVVNKTTPKIALIKDEFEISYLVTVFEDVKTGSIVPTNPR